MTRRRSNPEVDLSAVSDTQLRLELRVREYAKVMEAHGRFMVEQAQLLGFVDWAALNKAWGEKLAAARRRKS